MKPLIVLVDVSSLIWCLAKLRVVCPEIVSFHFTPEIVKASFIKFTVENVQIENNSFSIAYLTYHVLKPVFVHAKWNSE